MSEDFVEQLKACNDYAAAEMLVDEFEQAPRDVKKRAEPKLIKLLSNGRADEFVRSRAAELLGVSKTETARKSLEDIIVSIAATDTLLDLYDRKDAALRIARYGVEHAQPDQQRRIADALRIISDKGAIKFLQSMQSDVDPASGNRAQMLLEQIGGQYAVDALVKHRLDVLQKAGSRVEKFDEQALAIFQDTIEQARRGFSLSLNMSLGIFITGVFLIIVSAINLSFGKDALATWVTGGAGLASMVATFYREPLLRVQNAVANLVQTEIVFLGYIRQVTQISAMFEREYLNNEKFDVAALRKLLGFTERTMKETMPLVQTYTAVSVPLLEVEEAEEDQS